MSLGDGGVELGSGVGLGNGSKVAVGEKLLSPGDSGVESGSWVGLGSGSKVAVVTGLLSLGDSGVEFGSWVGLGIGAVQLRSNKAHMLRRTRQSVTTGRMASSIVWGAALHNEKAVMSSKGPYTRSSGGISLMISISLALVNRVSRARLPSCPMSTVSLLTYMRTKRRHISRSVPRLNLMA